MYSSGNSYILSYIVQQLEGKTCRELIQERIGGKIGLGDFPWMLSPEGVCSGGNGVSLTTEQMLRIGREDAIVGISFPRYSMRTLKALEFANDRNARVVTITDSIHSPMCLYSSCNLFAAGDMVSIVDSLVGPLSVINALVVALCLKRPQMVRDSLEELEGAWNNYQVSMHDEIDRIDEDSLFTLPGVEAARGGVLRRAQRAERTRQEE